jgi:hypothetical protein
VLEGIGGLELGGPVLEEALEGAGVLAGEDQGFGGQAVGDGVQPGARFSTERPGPGRVVRRVATVGLGSLGGGHRLGPVAGVVSGCFVASARPRPTDPDTPRDVQIIATRLYYTGVDSERQGCSCGNSFLSGPGSTVIAQIVS